VKFPTLDQKFLTWTNDYGSASGNASRIALAKKTQFLSALKMPKNPPMALPEKTKKFPS
jgi:hypothetical protein